MTQPTPVDGCRHCGVPYHPLHAQRWTEAAGWHVWTQPTQEQIKARMIERRANRIVRGARKLRIPLFAPANRRKPHPVPAAAPAAPVEPPKPKPPIRVSPPPAELRATGPLATNTPYGKPAAEVPHWQTEAIGAEWLAQETDRLDDLAALGGDLAAHQTIHTATRTPRPT